MYERHTHIVSNSGICDSCIYKSNICKSTLRMSLSCTCFIVFKVSYTCMQIHFLTLSNTRICRNCINVQRHLRKSVTQVCSTSFTSLLMDINFITWLDLKKNLYIQIANFFKRTQEWSDLHSKFTRPRNCNTVLCTWSTLEHMWQIIFASLTTTYDHWTSRDSGVMKNDEGYFCLFLK